MNYIVFTCAYMYVCSKYYVHLYQYFFWLYAVVMFCQNYDKIVIPLLRKNIKAKEKSNINNIYVNTHIHM